MGISEQRYATEICVDNWNAEILSLVKRSRSNHFWSLCGCVPHSIIAFNSQKFKDRMSLVQKLKSVPVITRKQTAYEDMNCIAILYSNTCTSVSCGYHTWSKFHFFGHPLLGLWWETGNIQKNYSFLTYSLHSHNKTNQNHSAQYLLVQSLYQPHGIRNCSCCQNVVPWMIPSL